MSSLARLFWGARDAQLTGEIVASAIQAPSHLNSGYNQVLSALKSFGRTGSIWCSTDRRARCANNSGRQRIKFWVHLSYGDNSGHQHIKFWVNLSSGYLESYGPAGLIRVEDKDTLNIDGCWPIIRSSWITGFLNWIFTRTLGWKWLGIGDTMCLDWKYKPSILRRLERKCHRAANLTFVFHITFLVFGDTTNIVATGEA